MEQNIDNLASVAGRKYLQRYWYENTVVARRWKLALMLSCWRLCMFGRTLYLTEAEHPITIEHKLGLRVGTRVWMEEVCYKHFSNTVQAFVYLGAVVLLVFVGLRFAELINERTALIGVGIEASMLFVLFIVMFYTPEDAYLNIDAEEPKVDNSAKEYLPLFREIYDELQDIGTMNAALGRHLTEMANKQESYMKELSQKFTYPSQNSVGKESVELIAQLKKPLDALSASMQEINANLRRITEKELEYLVRRELERVISGQKFSENGNSEDTHANIQTPYADRNEKTSETNR